MTCPDGNIVLDWIERRLAAESAATVEAHLATCDDCRRIVSELARGSGASEPPMKSPGAPRLERGQSVGRYLILGPVGGGAMGVVYSAYDPDLDRKVAIKLLRPDIGGQDRPARDHARLLREAQVMARVSHPNVVPVFDVGSFEGQVFVAMEFIEGTNLRFWLQEKPRHWREVRSKFADAGQGLAAAHAANIVHRDFKPDNVLIGRDGRVCVSDFGLARSLVAAVSPPDGPANPSKPVPSGLLTTTGLILGTPAYMAPEQLRGEPADAYSDQFSFSVALYEALYGVRPFVAETIEALVAEIVSGPPREPPPQARAHRWLHRAIIRGLAIAPRDRYPSMQALLDAIGVSPLQRWRRPIWIATGLAILGIGLGGYQTLHGRQAMLCQGAARKLTGVWDGQRKQAMERAFLATGQPYAPFALQTASREMDVYASRWVAMHQEACEATRLRGEQSEELLDRRMECLEERRQQMTALTALFGTADAQVVERAVKATRNLPRLEECADRRSLRERVRPPQPEVRGKIASLRADLARAKALRDAGSLRPAGAIVQTVLAAARNLGDRAFEAEPLFQLGGIQADAGDVKAGAQTLYDAAWMAEATGQDSLAARAWIILTGLVGYAQKKADEGHRLARQAEALIERLGGNKELEGRRLDALGMVLYSEGRYEQALAHHQQALTLLAEALGADHPQLGHTLGNAGADLDSLGRYQESLSLHQRALAILERNFGPSHPEVADCLYNLATSQSRVGQYEQALALHERALAIRERLLGPTHIGLFLSLEQMGSVLYSLGRDDQANVVYRRALAILDGQAADVDVSLQRATILVHLAEILRARHKFDEALNHQQRALDILERKLGPEHVQVGTSLTALATTLNEMGRHGQAILVCHRALQVMEKSLGVEHPAIADALTELGAAEIGKKAPERALAPLERSLRILESAGAAPDEKAGTSFLLARALWDSGRDKSRAQRLARSARDLYREAGAGSKSDLSEVEAWLARR